MTATRTPRTGGSQASTVIARRVLYLGPTRKRITVSVEAPEPDPPPGTGDWRCGYRIAGLGLRGRRYAHGIDAFQALQLAMVAIRHCLEPHRAGLSWPGGTLDVAFPRPVPFGWGAAVSRRLERMVERKVAAVGRAIRARARAAARASKPTAAR